MSTRNSIASIAGLLLFAPLCSFMEQIRNQKQQPAAQPTFHAEVSMVSLPAIVIDRQGRRVIDLKQEDFQVFEDGVEQEISGFATTEEPIAVVLALDTSGSVAARMGRIQVEGIRFVNSLHKEDSVAIVSFGSEVSLLQDFSTNRDRNAEGIRGTRSAGLTKLFDAVAAALTEVLTTDKERQALVLFSDGVDTGSQRVSEKQTLDLAKATFAPVYCIYFNTEGDWPISGRRPPYVLGPVPPSPPSRHGEYVRGHNYLANLARSTGGVVLDALRMDDLGRVFQQIVSDLASQYSIEYYPINQKRDDKFRAITVMVKRPGLVARTRPGYIARKGKNS